MSSPLRHMPPATSGPDVGHRDPVNAEKCGDVSLALALREQQLDRRHVVSGQLGMAGGLASGHALWAGMRSVRGPTRKSLGGSAGVVGVTADGALSPLGNHVCRVLGVGAEPKVGGVAASPIVARMAHAHSGRHRPARKLVGYDMGRAPALADVGSPVSQAADSAGPRPAISGLIDLGPERIGELLGGRIAGHRNLISGEPVGVCRTATGIAYGPNYTTPTFQLPTRQMAQALAQVPGEIEAKRGELQAQIDAQAGQQAPPDVDGS